jgi:outer membrane receptor protein involved in Fe transport
MNRGRGNGGRWNLSLSDTIELTNAVLIAPAGPRLDQLHGDALSGGGVARNTLTLEGGVFYNGLGLRFNGSYKSGTHVDGSGLPGSSDLRFGSLFTLDLRVFADLGRQEKLVKQIPFFKNARISLSVNNVFDARQKVTDQNGEVPLRYQPFLIDPNGRTFRVEFRKMF